MAEIDIVDFFEESDGWVFEVQVNGSTKTNHHVTLNNDYLNYITGSTEDPQQLVVESFEYLLERESNDSILAEFDLSNINNYFPDYEDEMKKSWS